MDKRLLLGIAVFVLVLFAESGAAYYYDGYNGWYRGDYRDGYYDNYQSHVMRSSGYYGGPRHESHTFYDKTTSSRFLSDGSFEQTTSYSKTTRESPGYRGYGGGYYGYPRYMNYGPYYGAYRNYYYPYDGGIIGGY